MQILFPVLPDQDLERLREIVDSATLEGDPDLPRIVKYLASALHVVAEAQIESAHKLQKILDAAGLGR